MLERASLFLLGGGAYAALELAWRGTTHWTMFLTGGVCLCLLQALADRPLPLGPAAAVGAAGVSGWSWPSAQSAAVCAHRRLGLCRRVGQSGRAGLPQIHRLLVFAVRVGHFCAAQCWKYRLSPSKIRLPALKSKLSYCLSGIIKAWKAKPDTERRYPP